MAKVYLGFDTDDLCRDLLHGTTAPAYQRLAAAGGGLDDSGPGLALAPTGVAPGPYGDATHVGQFTVGADGRLTAALNVPIAGGGGGAPGGADTNVQVNDAGAFYGDAGFRYLKTSKRVIVTDGTYTATLVSGGASVLAEHDGDYAAYLAGADRAGHFEGGSQTVDVCKDEALAASGSSYTVRVCGAGTGAVSASDGTNTGRLATGTFAVLSFGPFGMLGQLWTDQTAVATTLGSVVARLPVYDASGTFLGYMPIYDSIT